MQNTSIVNEDYLFELVTFMGIKKLEFLYWSTDWYNLSLYSVITYLKECRGKSTFLDVCNVYNIKIVSTFEKLIYKYKKKHLFTNKYNCEDRILFYVNYMTSYQSVYIGTLFIICY